MIEIAFNCNFLKEIRIKKGLSQERLCQELSNIGFTVCSYTLQKWEAGKTAPDSNDLAIIASFFQVPIQRFFNKGKTDNGQS